jgi:hypothetical protein
MKKAMTFKTKMKGYVKRILNKGVSRLVGINDLSRLLWQLKELTDTLDCGGSRMVLNEIASTSQGVQHLLTHTHREHLSLNDSLGRLHNSGFRCFSQNDEDGIILSIFSLIGTTNKKVVEICAGDGIECNAANLIVNHGWSGLLFDGSEENTARGRRFYSRCQDTFFFPPTLVTAWVTAENVNQLVSQHDFTGEIDLLSLDLDGMDFWVWKALTCVRPRVIVLEINSRWGPHQAVTLPYKADFQMDWNRHPWCCGASLAAFAKLGRERGYRLVGTNRSGVNAVLLRSDLGTDIFPEVSPVECYERSPTLRKWHPSWIPTRAERPEWHDVVHV